MHIIEGVGLNISRTEIIHWCYCEF